MKKGILYAIAFQVAVLLSMLVFAYAPLYFGDKIVLKASGYDPRDLLLGNYTRLRYDGVSRVKSPVGYKSDEQIYLSLVKKGEFYVGDKLSLKKPKKGLYLKGRVDYSSSSNYDTRLRFGIEKYFLPKKKALKLERDLRKTKAKVTLGVLFGNARIESVELIK